jgi:LuxR family transcriptional regulator, maltose regulon positive regulatory protein
VVRLAGTLRTRPRWGITRKSDRQVGSSGLTAIYNGQFKGLPADGRAGASEAPMAEPTRSGPPGAGVAERGLLLATKLHVPGPRPGFLPRQRLLERLADGTARELTLVCAPAGFGKTSLLGDWARRGPQPVAWLSLDVGDNDPVRFWRYIAVALDQVCEGVGERVAALLRGPPSLEAVVAVVVNALAGQADQVALVVDDYHLIEALAVHDSLGMLLERQPAQLRLVLASRTDPPLPLARLRARGQLTELRERDLRFTSEETALLLGEAMGLELSAGSVAALSARTEGWVAGLQLAGLSLRGHADPAGFVATFTGSHRYVLDYLTEEVLARQPEELVRFLLETSVLARLNGPLCEAVTGRADSQALLEAIERANLFLIPLDEVRGWWRYHHLFADLLQARLHRQQPERVPELHRAAVAWLERHGLADEAIRHALAAGDMEWASRLVERHADALTLRFEGATLLRWIAALPADLVRSRPRLCLIQAWTALMGGRVDEAEALVTQAERAFDAAEPFEPSVGRELSSLANIPAAIALWRADRARQRGDPERAMVFARQSLASLTEADRATRPMVRWQLAMAEWMRGRPAQAEPILAEVVTDPTWRCVPGMSSAASNRPRAAWVPRLRASATGWRSPARPASRCRWPGWATWAWPRCCVNGASWTPPWSTPPWGWRSAGSLATPSGWSSR